MFVRQYICSHSVYTRSRKRRGCFSSTLRIRAVSMMSMPTSELTLAPAECGGSCPGVGGARSPHPPHLPRRSLRSLREAGPRGTRGSRTPRSPVPPAAPNRSRSRSLDRHGLGEIARLVHIVPSSVCDVIREQLERNYCKHRG